MLGAILGALIGMLIGFFGYILVEAITGASLGKMILGMKAGTLDGKKGSTGLYFGRAAIKFAYLFPLLIIAIIPSAYAVMNILYYLLYLVFFIGCFFALRDSKQSLHDQLSKTAVYYKKDLS